MSAYDSLSASERPRKIQRILSLYPEFVKDILCYATLPGESSSPDVCSNGLSFSWDLLNDGHSVVVEHYNEQESLENLHGTLESWLKDMP